jgi:hypothetical protein
MTQHIDFHQVEPHQRDIDRRLLNWGKWCNGGTAPSVSPMFRLCPPPARVRGEAKPTAVDSADACRIAKGVAILPAAHRQAINWAYVKPSSPGKACREFGITMAGLAQLLREGRQMLINREV